MDRPQGPKAVQASEWGRYRLEPGVPRVLNVGTRELAVARKADEIWVMEGPGARQAIQSPDPNPACIQSRWASGDDEVEIEIRPAFPDRPLVLRPENPFHLLPDARARVFVRVPLWIRVEVPGDGGGLLAEVPVQILSDTWWGQLHEGEICYWLPIRARRQAGPDIYRDDRILCPLLLTNRSREELPVEKLLLRCTHLSVFRGRGSLWSDEVRVRYRGEAELSEIDLTGKPPPEASGAPRISGPRSPEPKGLTAKTFASLKKIPGIGPSL